MRPFWRRRNKKELVDDLCMTLNLDKENDIVIFDPYIINAADLIDAGIKNLVRVRRPGWGQGNISGNIMKLGFSEFKKELEKI